MNALDERLSESVGSFPVSPFVRPFEAFTVYTTLQALDVVR